MFSIVSSGDADGRAHRPCNSVVESWPSLLAQQKLELSKQYITTGASGGRELHSSITCGRMAVTASVERAQPAEVTVSVMMPSVAAELARRSALLPPMKSAAMSSSTGRLPVGKITVSLERLGRVSRFILNSVLSPSRRGVMSDFSS
jgi:hypothetical protein